jgi:methionyl-tRNA synthetase
MAAAMDEFAFHRALVALWDVIGVLNRYVDATQPWALAKDPLQRSRLDAVLYALAEGLRCLGIVLDPFLPEAAGKIRQALGQGEEPTLAAAAQWGCLAAGTPVRKVSGLFPRVDDKKAGTVKTPPEAGRNISIGQPAEQPEQAAVATISDFARLDLRVAEIIAADMVPKSKKLLKLTVSLGEETRTVLAGIAEHYRGADLVGKKVVVVANLQPATLMGIASNGMVLAASVEGRLAVVTLDRDLPPGAKVK